MLEGAVNSMKKLDWRSLVLGAVLTAAAWAWTARFQKQDAILKNNVVAQIYREDAGCFLFECTVASGKRKVVVLVPLSDKYEFYTAPAIVWTHPFEVEKVFPASDQLTKESMDCIFEKWSPYVKGPAIPGRRD